ncbi:MAG: GNAT family N-acetyltransferase [Chloroflexota bacterium]
MTERAPGQATGLLVRPARAEDVAAVRAFMLRIFEQDYGYGYQPRWHWDYDDLQGVYLDNPRHALIVAVDQATGEIVGTAGLRSGGPTAPSLPSWLVDRYRPPERTAQIVRVFTHPQHRRRGIARRLVQEIQRFVRDDGGYEVICLHTENAVDFWKAMGCQLVYDGRAGDPPDGSVHFELAP